MSSWESKEAAAIWRAGRDTRMRALGPATEAMLALARLHPDARILELGTGSADVAILAAERVASVLATDASDAMVKAAEAAVREAGASRVRVERMEAEALTVPDASFDAVIGRLVLMLVRDRARALAEARRVLVPGGRFAAATWSALAHNPFHAAVIETARAHAGSLADAEIVRAFSLSDPEALRRAVADAGFREVEVQKIAGERPMEAVEPEIERYRAMPQVTPLFASLDDGARARAWDEVAARWRACGPRIPLELLVVGATR